MPITNREINTIVTHADIVAEVGGERALRNIVPPDVDREDPTRTFRELAYRDVLKLLERRTPPISEAMLGSLDDIKDACRYGTLARLYASAITAEGDRHYVQWKRWNRALVDEVNGLRIRVNDAAELDASPLSVPMFRR